MYPPETLNTSAKASTPANGTTVYTVKSGDSLWSIAKKYGVTVDHIKKLNNLKTNDLKVGQKLKL